MYAPEMTKEDIEEALYREIVFAENDLTYWVSKDSVKGQFNFIYQAYRALESIAPQSRLLAAARSNIENLVRDWKPYIRTEKIGVIDKLELAIVTTL